MQGHWVPIRQIKTWKRTLERINENHIKWKWFIQSDHCSDASYKRIKREAEWGLVNARYCLKRGNLPFLSYLQDWQSAFS